MEEQETQFTPEPEAQQDLGEHSPALVTGQIAVLGLLLFALLGVGFVPKILAHLHTNTPIDHTDQQAAVSEVSDVRDTSSDAFADVTIAATSAFVWDIQKQRALYTKNPDDQLPLASLTKLMTALIAYEIMDGKMPVAISNDAIKQEGDSGLRAGEHFSLSSLVDLMRTESSNDGAFAIASVGGALLDTQDPASAFVRAMNVRAEELGLTQTYFRNPTGLDISETQAGAYGSARDIAFLMAYIIKTYPQILEETQESVLTIYNEEGQYHRVENTNPDVYDMPGLIGSKTGYTTLAGGNLAVAVDVSLNRPVIVAVLHSTHEGRFTDVEKLLKATREALQ